MPASQQPATPAPADAEVPYRQLVSAFLKLGLVGFGGPPAHIALIQNECVERRGWLTQERFLQGLALCQMLPGPVSTQLAIYAGFCLRSWRGAMVAGCAFILPAFALLLGLTWLYFRFGALPAIQGLFDGMSPVVLAMILAASYRLARATATDWILWATLAASAVLIGIFSFNIILLFLLAGLLGVLLYGPKRGPRISSAAYLILLPLWVELGWFFTKVGSLIFGGGLVIIPFIQSEVVDRMGWLTNQEFLDGLALGQMTPGPVVITATFIGYKVAGLLGAFVSTVAIFLPSFVFIFLAAGSLQRIERSRYVQAILKTVNVAAAGAILGAFLPLARHSLLHPFPLVLFGAALVTMLRYRISFLKVLAAGAFIGWLAG